MRDAIDRCLVFLGAQESEKAEVAKLATERTYPNATTVVYAGDPGHTLYLIEEGTVEIVVPSEDGGETVVAELHGGTSLASQYAGDFFGEMCLIDVEPRSASVRTKGEVTLVSIHARKLAELFQAHPELHVLVLTNIARVLSRRLREANARWGT